MAPPACRARSDDPNGAPRQTAEKGGLTYPIGAERISAALADVPQREELWIGFQRDQFLDGNWRLVMTATMNARRWSLLVYAVPRTISSFVREKLTIEALDRCREWLTRSRKPIWFDGLSEWQALFDERDGTMSYEEPRRRGAG